MHCSDKQTERAVDSDPCFKAMGNVHCGDMCAKSSRDLEYCCQLMSRACSQTALQSGARDALDVDSCLLLLHMTCAEDTLESLSKPAADSTP